MPDTQTPTYPAFFSELGPLEPLLKDPNISEIIVNDLRNIIFEKEGKFFQAGIKFDDIDDLQRVVRAILDRTGRILSADQPYVDVPFPNGARVNIVAPPITEHGPCITIRKFPLKRYTLDELQNSKFISENAAYFLGVCAVSKRNILISGATNSGKTTLLNALITRIPRGERLIVIEDTPELYITHQNYVKMQTKPQMPASPPITLQELIRNSLRMRPDRVLIGEVRGPEAFDMLQAMNTGHEGSMTTLHANSNRDALFRLETLCLIAHANLPLKALRQQISMSIDLLVHVKFFRSGERKVVRISEITGMEGDTITTHDIYKYEGNELKPTGLVPTFIPQLKDQGIVFPENFW